MPYQFATSNISPLNQRGVKMQQRRDRDISVGSRRNLLRTQGNNMSPQARMGLLKGSAGSQNAAFQSMLPGIYNKLGAGPPGSPVGGPARPAGTSMIGRPGVADPGSAGLRPPLTGAPGQSGMPGMPTDINSLIGMQFSEHQKAQAETLKRMDAFNAQLNAVGQGLRTSGQEALNLASSRINASQNLAADQARFQAAEAGMAGGRGEQAALEASNRDRIAGLGQVSSEAAQRSLQEQMAIQGLRLNAMSSQIVPNIQGMDFTGLGGLMVQDRGNQIAANAILGAGQAIGAGLGGARGFQVDGGEAALGRLPSGVSTLGPKPQGVNGWGTAGVDPGRPLPYAAAKALASGQQIQAYQNSDPRLAGAYNASVGQLGGKYSGRAAPPDISQGIRGQAFAGSGDPFAAIRGSNAPASAGSRVGSGTGFTSQQQQAMAGRGPSGGGSADIASSLGIQLGPRDTLTGVRGGGPANALMSQLGLAPEYEATVFRDFLGPRIDPKLLGRNLAAEQDINRASLIQKGRDLDAANPNRLIRTTGGQMDSFIQNSLRGIFG